MRPLWTALALLLALTPLGILAGGAAWGEWGARDFSDAAARRRIAAASRNLAPPPQAPQGLERLSSVWTAPFPQYAPSFVRRPALGYVLSAMFGSGIIILGFLIVSSLFAQGEAASERQTRWEPARETLEAHEDGAVPTPIESFRYRMNFVERTLSNLVNAMERALYAEELAKTDGLLQRLDPRIKVIGILALVIVSAMAHKLWVIGAVFAVAVTMAVMSRVSFGILAKRVWVAVLLFTGSHRASCSIYYPRPRGVAPSTARLAGHGSGARQRVLPRGPSGDRGNLIGLADTLHTLEPRAEGASSARRARGLRRYSGHDVPLYSLAASNRPRYVRVAPQPDGGKAGGTRTPPSGRRERRSSDVQEPSTQRRCLQCHALERLSRRSVCAG